jgi:hypothetical protein
MISTPDSFSSEKTLVMYPCSNSVIWHFFEDDDENYRVISPVNKAEDYSFPESIPYML